MSVHADITRKTDVEVALNMANAAYGLASGMMTTNAGAVFIPDGELADGEDAGRNGILIGTEANGFNGAAHVNDGKLEPIVDTSALEAANAEFQEALDAAKARMDDQQGNLNDAIDRMEQDRQEAANATQGVRDDLAKTEDSMNSYIESNDKAVSDAVKSIATVSTAADNAQNAADKVAGDLKATDVKVTQNTTDLGGLTTKMSAVKETADSALGLSTQHTQDIKGINDTLTTKYITKDETLIKVAEVQKTADAISSKLSSDYTTTANADAKYSTKSELNQSAAGIRSDVEKTYATKDSVTSQVSAVQQSADAIALNLSTNYQNSSDIAKTYATQAALKATSDSITSEVSQTYATKATTDALQNIADNAVETFMGSAVPTTSNAPAKDWNTDALRKQHSGDIYYSTTDGKSYRYGNPDSQGWQWTLIQDSDITKAIQDAANAQKTANTANSGVQKLNTDIPLTYATKSNLNQTASDISASVASTYATQKSLTDAQTAIKLTTDGITADISKNYQTTANADGKYATKTSLQATDDKIATSISAQASKDDAKYSTKNELSQTASGLDGRITETAQTAAGNLTTTKNEFQAKVDSINTTLSQTNDIAKGALSSAENKVLNGDFEQNAINGVQLGIAQNWNVEKGKVLINSDPNNLTHSGLAHISAYEPFFINSYVSDGNANGGGIAVQTGHTYRIGFWCNVNKGNPTQVYIYNRYMQLSGKAAVGNSSFNNVVVPSDYKITMDGTWHEYYTDVTITDSSVRLIRPRIGSDNVTDAYRVYIDSVYVKDVTDLVGIEADQQALTNRVSSAEQNLDGFKNTVAATYTTKSDFDSLESTASRTYPMRSSSGTVHAWYKIGTLTQVWQGRMTQIEMIISDGNNGTVQQNKSATLYIQKGWGGPSNPADSYYHTQFSISVINHNWPNVKVIGLSDGINRPLDIWISSGGSYTAGNYTLSGYWQDWSDGYTYSDDDPTGSLYTQSVGYYESPEQAKQSLANQVASTYTTKSEFTQTTDKIQSQVTQSLGAVSGGNMVYNPGFELGQTENSTTTNWSWGGDGVTGKIDKPAGAYKHSGDWRFYSSLPDGKIIWINSRRSMSFMKGHTYKVSAWVCLDTKGTIELGLESHTESGIVGNYDHSVQVNVSGEYTEISTYITATRDYAKAHVFLRFDQSKIGSNVRLDDVSCVDASDYSELSSRVTQTAQQWGVQLNQVATANSNAIADVNDALDNQSDALTATSDKIDDEISQRQAYMNFTQDETGNPLLELGASQNSNKVDITNDRVSFKSEGAEVAYISNRELHINNAIIVKSLEIAGFAFLIRADGHLTLTKL